MSEDKEKVMELAISLTKGDKKAFELIYDIYIDKMYRFVYFKVDKEEVDDILELTFLKVWDKRHTYNPKKSSFNSWIYTIARNTVIDHYRVNKPVEELELTMADEKKIADPKALAEESLVSDILREAVEELPKNYRDLVVLRFIEDLSYAELSEIFNKNEATIRVMQYRAMKKLKKILELRGINSNNI